jgi:hypothetical protein
VGFAVFKTVVCIAFAGAEIELKAAISVFD